MAACRVSTRVEPWATSPPAPPPGAAAHHSTLQLYALDGPLPLQPGASIVDVQRTMSGHVVGQTELVVLFGR